MNWDMRYAHKTRKIPEVSYRWSVPGEFERHMIVDHGIDPRRTLEDNHEEWQNLYEMFEGSMDKWHRHLHIIDYNGMGGDPLTHEHYYGESP